MARIIILYNLYCTIVINIQDIVHAFLDCRKKNNDERHRKKKNYSQLEQVRDIPYFNRFLQQCDLSNLKKINFAQIKSWI